MDTTNIFNIKKAILIGRKGELSKLWNSYQNGRNSIIYGEAGIGKSYLINYFLKNVYKGEYIKLNYVDEFDFFKYDVHNGIIYLELDDYRLESFEFIKQGLRMFPRVKFIIETRDKFVCSYLNEFMDFDLIHLDGLDKTSIIQFVSDIITDKDEQKYIIEKSKGNPLFVIFMLELITHSKKMSLYDYVPIIDDDVFIREIYIREFKKYPSEMKKKLAKSILKSVDDADKEIIVNISSLGNISYELFKKWEIHINDLDNHIDSLIRKGILIKCEEKLQINQKIEPYIWDELKPDWFSHGQLPDRMLDSLKNGEVVNKECYLSLVKNHIDQNIYIYLQAFTDKVSRQDIADMNTLLKKLVDENSNTSGKIDQISQKLDRMETTISYDIADVENIVIKLQNALYGIIDVDNQINELKDMLIHKKYIHLQKFNSIINFLGSIASLYSLPEVKYLLQNLISIIKSI